MKVAVFAYSRQGCKTARRILQLLQDAECQAYTMPRFEEPGFLPITKEVYGEVFSWADAMIFVGSCGIAVRKIAPYVKDKTTDPAVLAVDELGTYVIPLLSGHIGGANELALRLAENLGAMPVITTATDINHKFSVDTWAVRNGYVMSNLCRAKVVSSDILEKDVPLHSDFPVMTELPSGVVYGEEGSVGICISVYQKEPFARTLRLIPPILHLGIGCRKGTSVAAIREAVDMVLKQQDIDCRALKCVASINLKAGEEGLLQFCEERKLPVAFYSAEELKAVPGEFTPSEFVQSVTGVDNVCERAALMGAETLIVRKTAWNGVTVAVAAEHWEVHFGKTDRSGHWSR